MADRSAATVDVNVDAAMRATLQKHERQAIEQVREQYRQIVETNRQCQAAIVAIAQVMDWGPAQLNQIIGAQFFQVPPAPPLPPHEPETEPK